MPRQLITIPRNLSAATTRVLYVDATGASQVVCVSAGLGAEPMETNRPVREFCAWPGKRNFEGLWWSCTTGSMIPFESLLERQALTALDRDVSVAGISAQPFALLWPRTVRTPTPNPQAIPSQQPGKKLSGALVLCGHLVAGHLLQMLGGERASPSTRPPSVSRRVKRWKSATVETSSP
jgi:hypothetical protein